MTSKKMGSRDQKIAAAYATGKHTYASLAAKFGLSTPRIGQIVKQQREIVEASEPQDAASAIGGAATKGVNPDMLAAIVAAILTQQGTPVAAIEDDDDDEEDSEPMTVTKNRVVIKGHPSRKTWTKDMVKASRNAYLASKAKQGTKWPDWNHAGVLAARRVAAKS